MTLSWTLGGWACARPDGTTKCRSASASTCRIKLTRTGLKGQAARPRRDLKDDDQAPGAAQNEETTENFSGWSVGGSTEETKEGDIEALVAAEERGKQQACDDNVEEGWHRFVAEQSGELA